MYLPYVSDERWLQFKLHLQTNAASVPPAVELPSTLPDLSLSDTILALKDARNKGPPPEPEHAEAKCHVLQQDIHPIQCNSGFNSPMASDLSLSDTILALKDAHSKGPPPEPEHAEAKWHLLQQDIHPIQCNSGFNSHMASCPMCDYATDLQPMPKVRFAHFCLAMCHNHCHTANARTCAHVLQKRKYQRAVNSSHESCQVCVAVLRSV